MQHPIYLEKKAEWEDKIRQQEVSGKRVTQWCQENQIDRRRFYYWKSKFFPKIIDRSCFTELTNGKSTGIIIEYQGVRICLDKHFDSVTLKNCLTVLKRIKC
jgi:hypothetical protein